MDNILDYLPSESLLALRQTCRKIESSTRDRVLDKYFSGRFPQILGVVFEETDLKRAIEVLKDPILGSLVQIFRFYIFDIQTEAQMFDFSHSMAGVPSFQYLGASASVPLLVELLKHLPDNADIDFYFDTAHNSFSFSPRMRKLNKGGNLLITKGRGVVPVLRGTAIKVIQEAWEAVHEAASLVHKSLTLRTLDITVNGVIPHSVIQNCHVQDPENLPFLNSALDHSKSARIKMSWTVANNESLRNDQTYHYSPRKFLTSLFKLAGFVLLNISGLTQLPVDKLLPIKALNNVTSLKLRGLRVDKSHIRKYEKWFQDLITKPVATEMLILYDISLPDIHDWKTVLLSFKKKPEQCFLSLGNLKVGTSEKYVYFGGHPLTNDTDQSSSHQLSIVCSNWDYLKVEKLSENVALIHTHGATRISG
jgi:hypothetical protein